MNGTSKQDTNYHAQLLMDRIPSMMAYWDRDLLCRFANRAYVKWFGVDPARLIGTSIRDLLGPELFALNEPHIRAALRGEEQLFERIVPGPDGVKRHSLANYIPDVVEGAVVGFLVQVTEVTKLKETEAALQREQVLRARVERHTCELDELLRERTEMLSVLAHEVRQPLNNAFAALESAAKALGDGGSTAAMTRLTRAQAVMGQVVASLDNTLAVASLLARADPIQRDDVDVDTWLGLAIADIPESDRGRIVVERLTTTRTVSMDMSLMRLALRNLISNALKYAPPDTSVIVRLADCDQPLALLVDVIDAGEGVELGLRPRLFERGAHGKPVRGQIGHGLGLYIARQVMEMHGGRAELLGDTTGQTTFRLVIAQPAD